MLLVATYVMYEVNSTHLQAISVHRRPLFHDSMLILPYPGVPGSQTSSDPGEADRAVETSHSLPYTLMSNW